MRDDRRSPEAELYRKWYKSARWQKLRKAQLAAHPLCARHLVRAHVVPATVVHHKEPHRGDPHKFFAGPFESLCKPCHDGPMQSAERIGFSTEIDVDGWPVDPNHPQNLTG